jgi:hypothetical protein
VRIIKGRFFQKSDIAMVFLLTLLLGLFISLYGRPYIFHPDENFILKRPFKRILEYLQGDFSSTFSLFDFVVLCWYGLYFAVGKLFSLWDSFGGFRDAIVLEKFHIIYWGRVLSSIFVAAGNACYFHLLKDYFSKRHQLLIVLILVFNPFLIPSFFWLKYDAFMFLFFAMGFTCAFRYVNLGESKYRAYTYFILLLALSARIEAILFLLIFSFFDLLHHVRGKQLSCFFNKRFLLVCVLGATLWMCFTIYPIHIWYRFFGTSSAGLLESKTYEGVILTDVARNLLSLERVAATLWKYISMILLLALPMCILYLRYLVQESDITRKLLYGLYPFLFLITIAFTDFVAVHYVMPFIPLVFLLALIKVSSFKPNWATAWLWISALYVLTISVPFLIVSSLTTDTRVLARDYVLKNTTPMDTIAVETISMNGFHPLIDECPSELIEKAAHVESALKLSGDSYRLRSKNQLPNTDCRYILDLFEVNYLSVDPAQSNQFINTFDETHFRKMKPKLLISSKKSEKTLRTAGSYVFAARYEPFNFFDPRCNVLYTYKPTITIFSRP